MRVMVICSCGTKMICTAKSEGGNRYNINGRLVELTSVSFDKRNGFEVFEVSSAYMSHADFTAESQSDYEARIFA